MKRIQTIDTDNLAALEKADTGVGAFFDLDHTVLDGSSGVLFTRYMWRRGLMSTRQMLGIARAGLSYKLGGGDFRASSRVMMSLVAGIPDDEMWERARAWFEELIAPRITDEARRRIQQHREMNHHVALLSAATPYVNIPTAEALGLQAADVICTRLEIAGGVATGNVIEPICYGEGKVHWTREYAGERGIDLTRSFFYTDSYSDLPMLRVIGHPIAVNPDIRLRWLARREGWPIVRFH